MSSRGNLIFGFVDLIGESICKKIYGSFDIVNKYPIVKSLHIGDNKIITNKDNFNLYKPYPYINTLTEEINGNKIPVSNVKVTFIKDYISEGSNRDYSANMRVVDYCKTNDKGEYISFIEDGIYSIKVEGGKYNQIIHNQEIKSGLKNEYYITIDSLVKKRNENTIMLVGCDERIISGTMVNQNKKPIPNAEIIISQDKDIVVYCKTDKNGNYRFALPLGKYDIRLRGPKQSVKIINNFNFEDDKDFVKSLSESSNLFGGDWIWI